MHTFRHHHVADQLETVLGPHSTQFAHKQIACPVASEQRPSSIATEGNEVQFSLPVLALQSAGHKPPQDPPFQTKGGAPSASPSSL